MPTLAPLPPQTLATTVLLCASVNLSFLDISCKWNHTICSFWCLVISPNVLQSIYSVECTFCPVYCISIAYSVCIHLSVDALLVSCLSVVNICCLCMNVCSFVLGRLPSVKFPMFSKVGMYLFTFQQCEKVSVGHTLPTFGTVFFFWLH